jgi:hypothetical protein
MYNWKDYTLKCISILLLLFIYHFSGAQAMATKIERGGPRNVRYASSLVSMFGALRAPGDRAFHSV